MRRGAFSSFWSDAGGAITAIVFFVLISVLMWRGLSTAELSGRTEQLRLTDIAIRRAVVSYYSLEGSYPASIDVLCQSYGLVIDERFYVDYNIFASNIMPDITVLEVGK